MRETRQQNRKSYPFRGAPKVRFGGADRLIWIKASELGIFLFSMLCMRKEEA